MVLSKFKTLVSMYLLEQSSDCLGCDRCRSNVCDELGSLNSIVKLSSSDLSKDCLLITRGKLGWLSSFVVFLIPIHPFLHPTNFRPPYTSFCLYLTHGIPFLKKRNDSRVMGRGYSFHDIVEGEKD